jgi:hypothetical protein
MNYCRITSIFLAFVLCCSMPVMGVTTYLGGSPQIVAAIAGTNEFSAGQDAVVSISVQNRGLNVDKSVFTGTINRDDVPTTAKMVTVGLSSGSAPVIIKTDPQNIGDLKSQATAIVNIKTTITTDATVGEYQLPLIIRYTYLSSSDQPASDILQSTYTQVNETIPVTIKIKPTVKIAVIEAVPENLSVGAEGYLNLKLKNIGSGDGNKATVKIIRNGNSPVIPTDSSVYIGDFPRDGTTTCRYKVAISDNAEQQTYPIDIAVTYENDDGDVVTTATDTVGVPVLGKNTFKIVSEPITLLPGSENSIAVQYRNTGDAIAYHAEARLSAVDPFTSADNNAYLGDLKPGDTATAHFRLSTDSGAASRDYALDTQVRYRDSMDNSQISDTFKVNVNVAPPSQFISFMGFVSLGIVIAVIVIGAGYYLLVMRKKK